MHLAVFFSFEGCILQTVNLKKLSKFIKCPINFTLPLYKIKRTKNILCTSKCCARCYLVSKNLYHSFFIKKKLVKFVLDMSW